MEATGGDGGRMLCSYRDQAASSSYSISSSPGTVSTAYTSTGSLLSSIPTEAAIHLGLEDVCWEDRVPRERKMKQIKSTVQEFFRAPSANSSSSKGGGNMRVLERWFTELGVGWVLYLPLTDGACVGKLERSYDARSWIGVLTEMVEIFHFTMSISPYRRLEQAITEGKEKGIIRDQYQFARFIQEAMSKMLAFVDDLEVASNARITGNRVSLPYAELHALLGVRVALSKALTQIQLSSFHSPPSAEVERIVGAIISLLSAKEDKAGEAIWSTVAPYIRDRILEIDDNDDSSGTHQVPQDGTSDIHKVTRSVISNIKFLLHNYSLVAPIVSQAASLGNYVPQNGNNVPLDSMVLEMASCLEEKLASTRSESFSDQSLRFLFLLNNSYFIRKQNLLIDLDIFDVTDLTRKVEDYMERYIQVSWEPVLSCLFTPTPRCFGKNYSPLPKFVSEFQKSYSTQKLWKVPDPELRKILREAIKQKIVPGYTQYIEDNKVTIPKFTPQNLQEMLQELFEG